MGNFGPTPVVVAVNGFGEIDLPAQTVVKGELGGETPSVLAVEEPALLPFGSVQAAADETVEAGHIAKKEAGKIQTTLSPVRPTPGININFTDPVASTQTPN